MPLYKRKVIVEAGKPGQAGFSISDIRVAFQIVKNHTAVINQSVVRLWNLAQQTRNNLNDTENVITVRAGYEEDEAGLKVITKGNIARIVDEHAIPDYITSVDVLEASQALAASKQSYSYAENISIKSILSDVAGSVGLPVNGLDKVTDVRLNNGFSASGPSDKTFDDLVKKLGAEWSINNDEINVTVPGDTLETPAPLISPESGLIAISERVTSVDPTKRVAQLNGWTVQSLLLPEVVPGGKIKIESERTNGIFRVESVTHAGDTHTGVWSSIIEAVAI